MRLKMNTLPLFSKLATVTCSLMNPYSVLIYYCPIFCGIVHPAKESVLALMAIPHPLSSEVELLASPRVVAVVVTYNRRDLLPLTLSGIAGGELMPDSVIVVDNASTDGTGQYLDSLEYPVPLDIVRLSQNLGGAGGFTVGIDRALARHRADLVWVMDDDTEPTANSLSESVRAWRDYPGKNGTQPVMVASKVVWKDGSEHPMNTPRTKFGARREEFIRAEAVGARPIRSASFVSLLMDARVMRRVGLPLADFFIWNDDFEYSTRLALHRDAIFTESSVVIHHTKTAGNTNFNPGPRFYNDVRNKLWLFGRRRTLTPLEKFLYGGSSLRLWLSTMVRTDDRRTTSGYLIRGIRDALHPFRSNEQVFRGIYELELPRQAEQELPAISVNREDDSGQSLPPFSLLLCTYAQDQPEYLDQALSSNIVEQTLRPTETVLVADGPLTAELDEVVEQWRRRCADNTDLPELKVVRLESNRGLAQALNAGLRECRYELVARADADDISLPERFAVQIPAITGSAWAVCGTSMLEVSEDGISTECTRQALSGSEELAKALAHRNPMFHPTVVFRKSVIENVGGYEQVPGAEDYWLWSRVAKTGYSLQNLTEPLVKYRAGAGAYTKRGGLHAFKEDLEVQRTLYNAEMINKAQVLCNVVVRGVYRFIPERGRQKMFRTFIGRGSTAIFYPGAEEEG